MLATAVGAAGDVDAHATDLGQPLCLELLADGLGQATRLRDGDVARIGTRAGHDVAGQFGAGAGHLDRLEPGIQHGQLRLGEATEHDVLAVAESHIGAQLALDRGQRTELRCRHITEGCVGNRGHRAVGAATDHAGRHPPLIRIARRQAHDHALADRCCLDRAGTPGRRVAGLLDDLGDAAGPRRRGRQRVTHLQHATAQLVDAQLVDDPLQAGAQLVVAIARLVEHPQHGLDRGQQVFTRCELLNRQRRVRVGAETAGDVDPEAGLGRAVVEGPRRGDHTDVVEHRLAAVGRAAGEVDLELARQPLAQRVAHEVLERRLGPRGHVKELVRARTGQVTRHHVAHRVAARLTSGQADRAEGAHHVGHLGQLDVVDLHVLSRGDVPPAARVRLGEVAHEVHLLGRDRAGGQLDAHHLVGAALALAVDAVVEAHHPEHVFAELAREVLRHGPLEALDVALLLGVEVAGCMHHGGNRRRLLRHGHVATPFAHQRVVNPTTSVNNSVVAGPRQSPTGIFADFAERIA